MNELLREFQALVRVMGRLRAGGIGFSVLLLWLAVSMGAAEVGTPQRTVMTVSLGAGGVKPLDLRAAAGPPVITQEFDDLTVVAGANVQFLVTGDIGPVSYVWKKDGVVIPNATSESLYLANAQRSDAGAYTVTISNASGSVTGRPAKLTVLSPPVAQAQTVTTAEDTPVAVTLRASDADGDALTYRVVSGPSHGQLTGTAPNLRYTPNPNFNGEDGFWFSANDGKYDSASAQVTLIVTPVNDPPELPLIPDQVIGVGREFQLFLNGYDVDGAGEVLTYDLISGPAGMVVEGASGLLRWTPSWANSPGTNRVEVRVRDQGGLSASRQFRVIVQAGAPVIVTAPEARRVPAGAAFELRVQAEGTAPLSYQWRKDGVPLAGATSTNWGVAVSGLGDSGNYDVVVSNSVGGVASAVAEVTVILPGLVWVRPGSFQMGSAAGEPGRGQDEGPVTGVRLSQGIWLSDHEVTQHEFQGVMGFNPASVKGDNLPVDRVSWQKATNYCAQLTLRDRASGRLTRDYTYRLPTEAEWEYACRATSRTRYGFGDNVAALESFGWYAANAGQAMHAVKGKQTNTWGVYDLHGNVNEWCADWYGARLPGGEIVDPSGPTSGTRRVFRGGSFMDSATLCRSAERDGAWPVSRAVGLGFRVALAMGGASSPEIVVGPLGQSVDAGANVTLSVVARGTGPLSYRWQKDGVDLVDGPVIGGSATANLTLTNVSTNDAGRYRMVVGNGVGQATSGEAVVNVKAGAIVPSNMVWIKPGTFSMGSPSTEVDRWDGEGPQTQVTLSHGFWMSKWETTQEEYLAVMGNNPSHFTGDLRRPVEQVSWDDATNYCGKLTVRERAAGRLPAGYVYRLPTEAEWEYACRAGTTTRFSYGDDPSYTQLDGYAWYGGNSISTTHPVGLKKPTPWQLYDMNGNVWEWCSDWYGTYPGGSVRDPRGPGMGPIRVFRGGSWNTIGRFCRSAFRDDLWTTYRDSNLGFRPVLAPEVAVIIPPNMVWIEPGTFTMGSPAGEVDRGSDEGPQTRVTLSHGFWLSKYETTQEEYVAVMGNNPSYFTGDSKRPVERVSCYDATDYCGKLTIRERAAERLPVGYAYRLPTEAEWEYACRAGATTRFSYGVDPGYTQLGNYAWFLDNSATTVKPYGVSFGQNDRYYTTHAVGQKQPNARGLYDMNGNVWEWCSDWYGTYPGGNVTDPQGPSTGSIRVLRGGSWGNGGRYCRSALRLNNSPDSRSYFIGFRPVLAPGQ